MISFFYVFSFCSFNDYYTGGFTEYISDQNVVVTSSHAWIHDSFFRSLTNGAIVSTLTDSIVVIEHCIFSECTSNDVGGAIKFIGKNITMAKVCGYKCSHYKDGSDGMFSYLYGASTGEIRIIVSSLCFCAPKATSSNEAPMLVNDGIHRIKGLNSSNNYVFRRSFMYSVNTPDSLFEYSSVINSISSEIACLGLYNTKITISKSNFWNNSQGSSSYGLIYQISNSYTPSSLISYSTFGDNQKIVSAPLFYVTAGTMTVIQSSFYGTYSNNGAILSSIVSWYGTISLQHLSTYLCDAENHFQQGNTFINVAFNHVFFFMVTHIIL